MLAFALLFKLGDAAMDPMTRPFWVDRGFTLEEIGVVLTTGRMVATVSGAVLGGYLTTRWGMRTALWSLGALQAVSNLGYWVAAAVTPSKGLMIAAALFENFSGGMGTAAFVAYLMSVCEPRFAASQYALLSALLALTRAIDRADRGIADRACRLRHLLPAHVPAGAAGLRAAAIPLTRGAAARRRQRDCSLSQRPTAACISRWRCQATSTAPSPGISPTRRG